MLQILVRTVHPSFYGGIRCQTRRDASSEIEQPETPRIGGCVESLQCDLRSVRRKGDLQISAALADRLEALAVPAICSERKCNRLQPFGRFLISVGANVSI
jgi:hypothetical protein